MALFGRFTRFLIFALGLALGYAVAQFAHSNTALITVSLPPYSLQAPVYLLALVPLAAGLAVGWLYTVPARTSEFADHWRSWRTVRRMEKENRRLQRSLDKVLELPEGAGRTVAAEPPAATEAMPAAAAAVVPLEATAEAGEAAEAPRPHAGRAPRARVHLPAGEHPGPRPAARAN